MAGWPAGWMVKSDNKAHYGLSLRVSPLGQVWQLADIITILGQLLTFNLELKSEYFTGGPFI